MSGILVAAAAELIDPNMIDIEPDGMPVEHVTLEKLPMRRSMRRSGPSSKRRWPNVRLRRRQRADRIVLFGEQATGAGKVASERRDAAVPTAPTKRTSKRGSSMKQPQFRYRQIGAWRGLLTG